MSDMIERIARAMCEADGYHPDAESNDGEGQMLWTTYAGMAPSALSELLTPSTAMLIAGVKAMRNPDLDVTEKELALGWRAMISKAMEG